MDILQEGGSVLSEPHKIPTFLDEIISATVIRTSFDRSFRISPKIMEAEGQLIKRLFTALGAAPDLHAGQLETTTGEEIHLHAGGDKRRFTSRRAPQFPVPIRQ